MKVLIFGSRTWGNEEGENQMIVNRLLELPEGTLVITGGASGADLITENAIDYVWHNHRHKLELKVCHPNWAEGYDAGMHRNQIMRKEEPDLGIGYWDERSRGTKAMAEQLRLHGIEVEMHVRGKDE